MKRRLVTIFATGIGAIVACTTSARTLPPCESPAALAAIAPASGPVKIVAVGDIADCNGGKQSDVAAVIDQMQPNAVFALGDLAYPNGSIDDFLDCYAPSFGRFRSITRPVVGNHEYHTPHAGAYYAYFCGGAGKTFDGYYSFDIGAWHVVALNSVCGGDLDVDPSAPNDFGGCGDDSPQVTWLRADLAAHPHQCKIAMWHHPRWSSSTEGPTEAVRSFWKVLAANGVDIVLNGHAHDYQRFPQMNANGDPDPTGPRNFVVGTGGSSLSGFDSDAHIRSEVRDDTSHGVLTLALSEGSYAWSFVSIAGDSLRDDGESPCHL